MVAAVIRPQPKTKQYMVNGMRTSLVALAAGLITVVPPAQAQQEGAPLPPAAQTAEAVQPKLAKGLILIHEGRIFLSPCRDRSYFNVDDVSEGGGTFAALKDFGLAPGRNLYVELLAIERGGLLEVSGINFAHTTARCLGASANEEVWHAVGLNSEWEAVAGGGALLVERRDQPALRVTYDAAKSEYGQHRIEAPGVALAIKPGVCRLADGSTLTGWRATLTLDDGEVRDGCAWER